MLSVGYLGLYWPDIRYLIGRIFCTSLAVYPLLFFAEYRDIGRISGTVWPYNWYFSGRISGTLMAVNPVQP